MKTQARLVAMFFFQHSSMYITSLKRAPKVLLYAKVSLINRCHDTKKVKWKQKRLDFLILYSWSLHCHGNKHWKTISDLWFGCACCCGTPLLGFSLCAFTETIPTKEKNEKADTLIIHQSSKWKLKKKSLHSNGARWLCLQRTSEMSKFTFSNLHIIRLQQYESRENLYNRLVVCFCGKCNLFVCNVRSILIQTGIMHIKNVNFFIYTTVDLGGLQTGSLRIKMVIQIRNNINNIFSSGWPLRSQVLYKWIYSQYIYTITKMILPITCD